MDTNTDFKTEYKKKVIGVTGGMGSGKSTVTEILAGRGSIPIYADKLARIYTEQGTPIRSELLSIFGPGVFPDGVTPDRRYIASQVFSDPEKLHKLTSIIHPLVRKKTLELIESTTDGTSIVWEVPLLFETGGERICSHTIAVFSTFEIAFHRVRNRDGLTLEEFTNRMRNQMPIEEKIKRSMFQIENNGSLEDLERNTLKIFDKIRRDEH